MLVWIITFVVAGVIYYKVYGKKKYRLFFDVDGTLTAVEGDNPNSLYNLYLTHGDNWVFTDNIINKLFENRDKFDKISAFLGILSEMDNVEICLTTNNHKNAIKGMWENLFHLPWKKVSDKSIFRESQTIKSDHIRNNMNGICIYFEDDSVNLQKAKDIYSLGIVDCSDWIVHKLPDKISHDTVLKFLENNSKMQYRMI
jgi:hypothetical protein